MEIKEQIKFYADVFQMAFSLTQNEEASLEIVRQIGLDDRTNFISQSKVQPKNADLPLTPATPKQIETLKKFKKYKEGISKVEATQIIGELFKK